MSKELADLVRERLEVEQALSVHAASSPRFREALRRDPVAAVRALLGPDADLGDIEIEVVDLPAARIRVSVPVAADEELEERELAAVAGGTKTVPSGDTSIFQPAEQERAQFFQVLSGITKSQGDAARSIIQNLKA